MNHAINKYPIKDFYGRILGFVEEDKEGNRRLRDFSQRVLGTYDKSLNKTRDFYGRIVGNGDILTTLLPMKK